MSHITFLNGLLLALLLAAGRRAKLLAAWLRPRTAVAGQGLVEYALILVLIAVVVIGILTQVGGQTSKVYQQIACTLEGGTLHQDNGNNNSQKCK